MSNKIKELLLGSIMLIFSVGYFYFSLEINTRSDVIDSRTFPYILSCLMLVLSLWQLANAFFLDSSKQSKGINDKDYATVIKTAFSIIVYIYFFEDIGFIIMSLLFLFVMFVLLTPQIYKPKYPMYLSIATFTSVAIYVIFRYGLDVLLPQGIITVI